MRSKEFDNILYSLRILYTTFGTIHLYRMQNKIAEIKHKKVETILNKELYDIIEKYQKVEYENNDRLASKHIWSFWWQGEDAAPEIIKLCMASMRANKGEFTVTVIDRNNYKEWIELPDYILDKVNRGLISITHLSDIIRMALLNKYGGVWLDATVIMLNKIEDSWLRYPYFTAKQKEKACPIVSKYRWTGSFVIGKKRFPYYSFLMECFLEYWKNHNEMIDYFLIDYLTDIAYSTLAFYRKSFNELPENNIKMYNAALHMNEEFDYQKYKQLKECTILFKIQRRNQYIKNYKGKETLYGYLYNKYKHFQGNE